MGIRVALDFLLYSGILAENQGYERVSPDHAHARAEFEPRNLMAFYGVAFIVAGPVSNFEI